MNLKSGDVDTEIQSNHQGLKIVIPQLGPLAVVLAHVQHQ